MSTQPPEAQRIAFANGLAWLLLRHVKDLKPEVCKFIEAVRDARTVDEMMRTAYADADAYAAYAAYASAAYASAYASSAYASASAAYAQAYAVKAGVPEHEVAALRMTCLGE